MVICVQYGMEVPGRRQSGTCGRVLSLRGARGWRQSGTLGRMLSLRGSGSGPWGGVSGAVVMRRLMGGESNPCAM
jgi:hypothetical protein